MHASNHMNFLKAEKINEQLLLPARGCCWQEDVASYWRHGLPSATVGEAWGWSDEAVQTASGRLQAWWRCCCFAEEKSCIPPELGKMTDRGHDRRWNDAVKPQREGGEERPEGGPSNAQRPSSLTQWRDKLRKGRKAGARSLQWSRGSTAWERGLEVWGASPRSSGMGGRLAL